MNLHLYFPHFLTKLDEIRYWYVRNVEQLWLWSESVRWESWLTSLAITEFLSVLSSFIIRFPCKRSAPNDVDNLWDQGRTYFLCDRKLNYIFRLPHKNDILSVKNALVSLCTRSQNTPFAVLFVSGVRALISVCCIFTLHAADCLNQFLGVCAAVHNL